MTITSHSSQHDILRVSTGSNPTAVAGAVAGAIRNHGTAHVQVVGAGALNQAVKAVAIAQGYLDDGELELVCVPHFADIEIDGEARTAIRLDVEDRQHRVPGHHQPL
jgi:stage V sporulation protein S